MGGCHHLLVKFVVKLNYIMMNDLSYYNILALNNFFWFPHSTSIDYKEDRQWCGFLQSAGAAAGSNLYSVDCATLSSKSVVMLVA